MTPRGLISPIFIALFALFSLVAVIWVIPATNAQEFVLVESRCNKAMPGHRTPRGFGSLGQKSHGKKLSLSV
jgi:hypothetical protein